MPANFIKNTPRVNYAALYRLANSQLSIMPSTRVDVALLMAVCIRTSNAKSTICRFDSSFKERLAQVTSEADCLAGEFLQRASIKHGPRKYQISKYRFKPEALWASQRLAENQGHGHLDSVILSCSWGIAQTTGIDLYHSIRGENFWDYWEHYKGDEDMQMRDLIGRLDLAIFEHKGDLFKALRCIQPGSLLESDMWHSDRILALASHLREGIEAIPKLTGS